MEKEDFIVGKWYRKEGWVCTKAIKFLNFQVDGQFVSSLSITKSGGFHKDMISWGTDYSLFQEVPIEEILPYLPGDHPDKKLTEFPKEGCVFDEDGSVLQYLISIGYEGKGLSDEELYTKWYSTYVTSLTYPSHIVEHYTIEEINKFINQKTNKNEVFSIETKDSRPVITGAIRLRSRRQQVAIGSRPSGNSASIITCKTKFIKAKISGEVRQRTNS